MRNRSPVVGASATPRTDRTSAMLAIQDVALNLFLADGYANVSVEDVAVRASISPRSVYRYFGTKEQLVVWDPIDSRLIEYVEESMAERASASSWIASLLSGYVQLIRRAMSLQDEERLRIRMRLIGSVAALRSGELKQMESLAISLFGVMGSSGLGDDHPTMLLRIVAYQVAWGLLAIADEWAENNFERSFHVVLDEAAPTLIASIEATLNPLIR